MVRAEVGEQGSGSSATIEARTGRVDFCQHRELKRVPPIFNAGMWARFKVTDEGRTLTAEGIAKMKTNAEPNRLIPVETRSTAALAPPADASVGKRWRFRRNLVIYVAHRQGLSQRLLADVFDLPRSRIGAIIQEFRRLDRRPSPNSTPLDSP